MTLQISGDTLFMRQRKKAVNADNVNKSLF